MSFGHKIYTSAEVVISPTSDSGVDHPPTPLARKHGGVEGHELLQLNYWLSTPLSYGSVPLSYGAHNTTIPSGLSEW